MPSKENDEAKVGGKAYTLKEALHGNIMTVEALINVLAAKGLIARDEVMREIKRLQVEMGKANN
jgi:hypothetical protein